MRHPKQTYSRYPRVFVLGGSDSVSGLVKDPSQNIPISGNNDAWRLIPKDLEWSRCHVSPSYFRQGTRINFSLCSVILNLISDADQNPRTLRIAERVTADHRARLINDPRNIRHTGRDEIARKLQNVSGLRTPKVLRLRNPTLARLNKRIAAAGFAFPAIVRRTGTQTGEILGLFETPEDLTEHFEEMTEEYYFTEFVDCRCPDGLYRKMRLFNIGGDIILRHVLISDKWKINSSARNDLMKDRQDLRDEECRYFGADIPPALARAREIMKAVAKHINLEYFGLDLGLHGDGEFVLFEANATMNFTSRSTDPCFDYTLTSIGQAKNALGRLLLERGNADSAG